MTVTCPPTGESFVQLEYFKVIERLAGATQTPYGRELARALQPMQDLAAIRLALTEAAEAGQLLGEEGPLPIGGGEDLRPALERLQTEGLRLESDVLRDVQLAIEAACACRRHLLESDACPALRRHAEDLVPLPDLAAEIRRSIGPRGEVLDSASLTLEDLRRQLQRERSRIKRQLEKLLADDGLQGVFQEQLITDRNGRYVVPVRTDHSGRIKGFVHDVSASGQTLYMEPAETLDSNNRVQTLARDIQHEIERILAHLTAEVREARLALVDNQAILAHLDLRQAVARLGRELDAATPELTSRPLLELRAARHPLLVLQQRESGASADAVAPVDVLLDEAQQVLIISGPNTGGKTVTLKTAGLLVLMVRAGLPIPCAPGSRLFPFRPVLADIGDEQSIEQSLSTFSGHLARLKMILAQIEPGGLVVLDELGTGTDPGEGAALALAGLDLLRRSGAKVMATTHLHMIKGYAQLEDGVENAAVEFDADTLQPTYRLHYGIPGASHAFTIAERLGLPAEMLARASDYLGQGERDGAAVIERLQTLRTALEEELSSVGDLRREAEQEQTLSKRLREDLEARRQAILEETRQVGSRLLADAEARLRDLFRQVPQDRAAPQEQARLTRAVRDMKQELPEAAAKGPEHVPQEVAIGERLYLPALGIDAEVVTVSGKQVELMAGGKKLRQPLTALRQYQPRRFAERAVARPRIRDRVSREAFRPRLVLVGKRAEEVQGMLDRFLDDALLHGQHRLEIVHGAGQGILRRAVREFLAGRVDVTAFHAAGVAEGGENITVVEMRH